MANHGSKFLSVNLNKSYGKQQHSHNTQYPHFNGSGGPHGPSGAGRGRAGTGGMLVLSRTHGAAPKIVPKLSVPPPLNLPSLRKEHEKFDMSGPGGPGTGAGTGSGSRPNSSGIGWTKPVAAAFTAFPEKSEIRADIVALDGTSATAGASRGVGSYMPPSARFSGSGVVGPASSVRDIQSSVDKAVLLRGEDFPSLQAVRPVSSGTPQKQKDGLSHKQKPVVLDEVGQDKERNCHLDPLGDMGPPGWSSNHTYGNRYVENGCKGNGNRKQEEYFPDPLPLVRMNPRSDWADDERDTGHRFVDQGRDITGYSNTESYWDRDFDLPRPSIWPHKPAPSHYGRWGERDNETGKKISSEVLKVDLCSKDARASSGEGKEVNKWRNSLMSKDGFSSQETGNYRFDVGSRIAAVHNNMTNENKYNPPQYMDIAHNRDSAFGRRDLGFVGHQQQQQRNNSDCSIRQVTEQPYRYRADNFQSNNLSKSSFASGGKMHHVADPILNMSRDKRFSNSDRDYGTTCFDERDIFSEGLVGVIKRKKDGARSTDFHDPVRESFEAELERVQKMQELQRQRTIEEQERALEKVRREEDERHRRIREEEERLQKLEEEARETAWRAEQEHVEAVQKAEEQRVAREEEKKRMQLEEERRKLAAKQKLEELEARMAMRKAETLKMAVDELSEVEVKGKFVSRNLDLDTWEDSERMVETVMNSGSFDSSSHSTPVEMSSRPYSLREGSMNFSDRGKANDNNSSWKMDLLLEKGGSLSTPPLSDQVAGHYSPGRDAFGGGRANPQKEFNGGARYTPSRGYLKPAIQDPYSDEFGCHKDQRWNSGCVGDSFEKIRQMDSEFHNGNVDRYGGDNSGWGQGRPRGNDHPPYPEQLYPYSEGNDLYNNFGRSRYCMKQPHVLPPPSLLPSQRPNYSRVTEHADASSTFVDNNIHYTHAERTESSAYSGSSNQRGLLEPSVIFRPQQENNNSEDKNLKDGSRCDSQSSLSVSSPPTSPPHLSHDELDVSRDAQVTSVVAAHNVNSGLMVPDNISGVEDEEWAVENYDTMQQQEEYDEDEDGYREEDEVRERDDENLELTQNFEGQELGEAESPQDMDNMVLGFDEGVEVVLPNDDFEKKIEIPESSVEIVEERGTIDGLSSAEPIVTNTDEKSALQGCIGQRVGDSSDGTVLVAQQITSSTAVTSQACNNVPSLSSSSGAQTDLPVKLQFGLFSGPSLIPSPVPAIQIGSIQMPLHIHPPVGQAMTHMHPSQPPMFQFGQLRYTSSISQGILPVGSQSLSFLHQPNILGHFNINQNVSGSVTHEPSRENVIELPSLPKNNNQLSIVSRDNPTDDETIRKADRNEDSTSNDKSNPASDEKTKPKTYLPSSKSKAPESHSQSVGGNRNYSGRRGLGPFSGGRGRRFAHAVKNTNPRAINSQDHDMKVDPNGFQRRSMRTVQRTEFRVRENYDRRPAPGSFNNFGSDDNRSNYTGKAVGVFMRSGSKRGTSSNRTMMPRIESEPSVSVSVTSQEVSGDRGAKYLPVKSQSTSHPDETSFRRNASEEDVEAPLQSGVVSVFKQPGIEAPSDDDDFIEVRSKRQMLNDRREQREKEIMAKSRTTKPPRKPRASRQRDVVSRSYNKQPAPLASGQMKSFQLDLASKNPQFTKNEVSTRRATASSKAPIGTPPINSDAQAIMSTQAGSVSVISKGVKEREPRMMIDSKNKVMSLSQSQIDEAMKPAQYDSHVPTVGGHSSTVGDAIFPTPSILTTDKTFTSGASPINSLMAGEKIKFSAVTSPTVLPSNSHVVSHGIGAPGSNRPERQMARSFPEKEDSLFFSKEKNLTTDHVQDCEADAEAAASAVAVAAISSDETVRNGLGSVSDTTHFSAAGIKGMSTGVVGHQHMASRSQSEELSSVSLPADLSVETTPISLWPPLPSPQGSSSQMLSHFPAGPPSHFPFYEMNPLLGGPIFAFSPHEESSGPQSQPQKSTAAASRPLGNWPQCHSSVDSFYGAPAGFPGPFIGQPGGIQGPPHMVVYNHFAPVGQYGQVGLSFMGTTYIPSGKQADWKNNASASSTMHSGEGDVNKMNTSNVQQSGPSMTGPIQHLAPGSPLLPMPPPSPMFDVSHFQAAASDLPLQAQWGDIPAAPLHPVPVSRPSQPTVEGGLLTSQVNHGHPIEQSQTANRFVESRTPSQSNNNNNSSPSFTDSTNVAPFSSQLGLADSSVAVQTYSGSSNALESSKIDTGNNSRTSHASSLKTPFPKKNVPTQHGNNNNNNAGGYGYQRGGPTTHNRTNSAGHEFSHRRMSYHGRNQSGGMEKGFHPVKVKQIYVAKQTSSGGPAT